MEKILKIFSIIYQETLYLNEKYNKNKKIKKLIYRKKLKKTNVAKFYYYILKTILNVYIYNIYILNCI